MHVTKSCSHSLRLEHNCPCTKPTKTFPSPCVVEDPCDLLLHSLLPLPNYSSHYFPRCRKIAILDMLPMHTAILLYSHPITHHASSAQLLRQLMARTTISKTTTYWLHYTFNVLYEPLEVSLKKNPAEMTKHSYC